MAEARVLVVDDERDICRALEFLLLSEGYEVSSALDAQQALELFNKKAYDLVITDLRMPRSDGIELLQQLKALSPETPVVIMTAYASVESAVEAMKKGAADYIVKPFINEEIKLTVRRLLEQSRLRAENLALRRELSQHRRRCKEVVFISDVMVRLFELIDDVAPTKSNVLLLGESGTGKDLIAEIIHCQSPRSKGSFISINCSAIPEGLLESELFGHRRGAFTGASSDKKGLIELAHEGTLFLDEIGDMPLPLQAKLLRVLETGELMPLGDTRARHVDVRLIAATNQDLEAKIREGSFREDLYWRLSVFEIRIPPLRERREDIPLLVDFFIRKFAQDNRKPVREASAEALQVLEAYPWPGNVRELANVIERAVVLARGERIGLEHLPEKLRLGSRVSNPSTLKEALSQYERSLILRVYEEHGRNKEATARHLGIDLATLYRKLKKLGIEG
jgi:DNA-binding NtrC family response regulator